MKYEKPKIILASYPRSGNTFLRNILLDVFGQYSWNSLEVYLKAFNRIKKLEKAKKSNSFDQKLDAKLAQLSEWINYPIIKTHELPKAVLHECQSDAIIIYLIRDGRDALVSQAYHNVNIVNPGADFSSSLKHSIKAPRGTHFGGWSKNVSLWRDVATLIINFDDLINNPAGVANKISDLTGLPIIDLDKMPSFQSQREGKAFFGGNSRPNYTEDARQVYNQFFFRKGESGEWKKEMSDEEKELYWKHHGDVSEEMGFKKDGSFARTQWYQEI